MHPKVVERLATSSRGKKTAVSCWSNGNRALYKLDQAEKPLTLARAEIGLNLNYLVWLLEQATEEAEETLWAAELVLAIEGMPLDN